MPDEKRRDWVDTVSKLLIPILIFAASAWFSIQKNNSDAANQQFQRENEILKLAASSNDAERTLGLKTIEILKEQGKFSKEMEPVVKAISQGRPSDPATQRAQNILEPAKPGPSSDSQPTPTARDQNPKVYIQIAEEEQRADAAELTSTLQKAGYDVPGTELVSPGLQNTYVRLFSPQNKQHADRVLDLMHKMGFTVEEQDFSNTPLREKTQPGFLEVWIGHKQKPLTKS
jgi:cell division septation protein DedD